MNRSLILRRALALAGGVVLATTAALAVPSPASAHESSVEGKAVCDQKTGDWIVTWIVRNSEDDIPGTLTSVALEPAGTTVTNIAVGATLPAGGELTGTQVVPNGQTSARLAVTAKWIRGDRVIEDKKPRKGEVTFEGKCDKPTPPSPEPEPAEPALDLDSTCDEFSLTFTNPEDGADFEATLTPSTGEAVTVEVTAGDDEKVTFPASEGLTVEVSVGDEKATVAWEEPEDCGGGGGGLPVTGTAVGGIVGASAVLLALGVVLFLAARRRRIRFTV